MSPLDKGESVGAYVARSVEIIERSGVPFRVNPMGTCIEGTWDECFDLIKKCYERMSKDCSRVTVSIKVDARKGHDGRLESKVTSVEKRLGRKLPS